MQLATRPAQWATIEVVDHGRPRPFKLDFDPDPAFGRDVPSRWVERAEFVVAREGDASDPQRLKQP